jgi:hypothetical protein
VKPKLSATSNKRCNQTQKDNPNKNIFKYGKLNSFSLYKSSAFVK